MIPQNDHLVLVPDFQTVVLDTNVLLDLFVFHDPRWQALYAALETGRVRAATREDCDREWQVVLNYPQLPLDDARRAASLAEYRALITVGSFAAKSGIVLPRCTDRDDQKFLELARDAAAQVLISKDKALLKLARKTAQAGLFQILPPAQWVARYGT
jgi:predicted nucleic acid-binding protein